MVALGSPLAGPRLVMKGVIVRLVPPRGPLMRPLMLPTAMIEVAPAAAVGTCTSAPRIWPAPAPPEVAFSAGPTDCSPVALSRKRRTCSPARKEPATLIWPLRIAFGRPWFGASVGSAGVTDGAATVSVTRVGGGVYRM